MKKSPKVISLLFFMIFLFSCDEPVTVVTNFVHPDGSVTRRIVMKYKKNQIEPSISQVPYDSTWTIETMMEPGEKDTTWTYTLEKDFASADEINLAYQADSGCNKMLTRSASFSKRFRWFNTFYSYSEKVSKVLNAELKAENVFNEEEIRYFYMPSAMLDSLVNSPDSTRFKEIKAINDSLEDRYLFTALIEEWIMRYLQLNPDSGYIIPLKNIMVEVAVANESNEDTMFMIALGEDYFNINKESIKLAMTEVDSLLETAISAAFYTNESLMPFKLVATNGLVDSTQKVSWPVDSKYFISQDYIMWSESKKTNPWAWMVSGGFILFVVVGLVLRMLRKKD